MALTSGPCGGPRHPIGMSRGDPNRQALIDKMTNNAASEKSGPSEHRHNPICHGYRFPELDARWPLARQPRSGVPSNKAHQPAKKGQWSRQQPLTSTSCSCCAARICSCPCVIRRMAMCPCMAILH